VTPIWPPRKPRPEAARRRLEERARALVEWGAKLERDLAAPRAERDEAIREAYLAGLPVRDIAEVVGLTHQHVSRIVRS
jgi:hypothetical protein